MLGYNRLGCKVENWTLGETDYKKIVAPGDVLMGRSALGKFVVLGMINYSSTLWVENCDMAPISDGGFLKRVIVARQLTEQCMTVPS